MKSFNIGLAGYGTVGRNFCEMLNTRKEDLERLTNHKINIKKILVKTKKHRFFNFTTSLVYDYKELLTDDIDCVIELIGGVDTAKNLVFSALLKNKAVITANKALVSSCMKQLKDMNSTSQFAYEAAVGGGIPVINSLLHDFVSDIITETYGILNGTTNYMLSNMEEHGTSYKDVLKDAQEKGFAEADPSADVDGLDAQAKLKIILQLSYGISVHPYDIPTRGISEIISEDFEYAHKLNSTIKLLAVSKTEDNELYAYVSPVIVKNTSIISNVNGSQNIVNIKSNNLENTYLIGHGAGGNPTANSVMNDLISVIKGEKNFSKSFGNKESNLIFDKDFPAQFYVRLCVNDTNGIIGTIGSICERYDVSIYSILQNPIKDPKNCIFVIITDECYLSEIDNISNEIVEYKWCNIKPFTAPIM